MNVSSSIMTLKGERLTDTRSKIQCTDIDWKKIEEHINRLQTRITKAVKERKCKLLPNTERVMKCLSGVR